MRLERSLEMCLRLVRSSESRGEQAEQPGHGAEEGDDRDHHEPIAVRLEHLVQTCRSLGIAESRAQLGQIVERRQPVCVARNVVEIVSGEVLELGASFCFPTGLEEQEGERAAP